MKTIFVVDDSDTNLTMAETALETQYRVMTMPSAARMFELLNKVNPDIILLDIEMPETNGFEALQKLKNNGAWSSIPVIFLTGNTSSDIEARGFEMGVVDYVTKPFSAPVLQRRIKTHLDIDKKIRERTVELNRLQSGIVSVLANMVENRNKRTSGHIERMSKYLKIMIDEMKKRGVYVDELQSWDLDKILLSSLMYDLGKISITDIIINKPGKLTTGEYEIMKTHTTEGERIINKIIDLTGEGDYLNNAKLFAGFHHERWDGKGYPYGLKGEKIPLQGRIMAIADVYDALMSERPYKKAFSHDETVEIIMENSGTKYDPKIVEVFFEAKDQFETIIKNGV